MTESSRISRARALRASSTDAEQKLWSILRSRQLAGAKFRRQLPIDRYFADFACEALKLVIEVDGSQHMADEAYDAARTDRLRELGWIVLRFWNTDVLTNIEGVADAILAEIKLIRS